MKATRFTVPLIAALALVLGGAVFVGAQIINPPPGAFVANTVCLDKTNQDACSVRDAANVWAFRNGTSVQAIRVYGTFTDSSNYERLELSYGLGAGNRFYINTAKAGTGTARGLGFAVAGTEYWTVNTSGHFTPITDNSANVGAAAAAVKTAFVYNLDVVSGGSTTIGVGVGSVKMTSGNAATNAAWIPIQLAGTIYYVPGWTTNNP